MASVALCAAAAPQVPDAVPDTNVGTADPQAGSDNTAIRATLSEEMVEDETAAAQGASPFLRLDGFTGPLDHLLTLARAQKIDLATLSLAALVDQLTAALRQAPMALSLGQKGDWVVMAAWLVQLRTRLLLPADAPEQREAAADAAQLRGQLTTLQAMQGLAGWLERRSQLGHEVFARGQPEVFGVSADAGPAVDVIAFLWASLALFDDEAASPETMPVYRPLHLDLYAVAEARGRILQRLANSPEGLSLERLLPDERDDADGESRQGLRQRSAWSSTFIASLELTKQGDVVLEQEGDFQTIYVAPISSSECKPQPSHTSNVR